MPSFPGHSFLSSETSTFFFCPAELSSVTLELSFLGLLARNAVKINCIFFQNLQLLTSFTQPCWLNQKSKILLPEHRIYFPAFSCPSALSKQGSPWITWNENELYF